jgi:hypothetical protein
LASLNAARAHPSARSQYRNGGAHPIRASDHSRLASSCGEKAGRRS